VALVLELTRQLAKDKMDVAVAVAVAVAELALADVAAMEL
jgi:hypothetical protein